MEIKKNIINFTNKILQGDALSVLKILPDESIDMCMTSPPYWALRDYGVKGQLGLESTFQQYINDLCDIFDEIRWILKESGTCWVNLGDTYASGGGKGVEQSARRRQRKNTGAYPDQAPKSKLRTDMGKCLLQIPARFSIEMTNRDWILRNEIIWYKPNCMPASVKDRFTVDFEKLFFFVKNKRYSFNQQFEPLKKESLRRTKYPFGGTPGKAYPNEKREKPYPNEWRLNPNGRNKRCVWRISPRSYKEAHFAVYPEELCMTPIEAGCPKGGIVLDPFFGSGTTGVVAKKLNRKYIGIELNQKYIKIARQRLKNTIGSLF